jgi:hypothetical protein
MGQRAWWLVLVVAVAGLPGCDRSREDGSEDHGRGPSGSTWGDRYLDEIQPTFDRRCVGCHSCYNAPCQLKLTSYEGVDRGASKENIYATRYLSSMAPSRLYIDARSTAEWQSTKGFFPVVRHHPDDPERNLEESVLYHFLAAGQQQKAATPFQPGEPTLFRGDAVKSRTCAKNVNEVKSFLAKHPDQGMPFGCPELGTADYDRIVSWIADGAPGPSEAAAEKLASPSTGSAGEAVLQGWEAFLNGSSAKERLTARYLYEHLFLADLHFEEIPGDWYRLVRSRTAAPLAIDEIATRRPYDDPKGAFHYRLQKNVSTVVHKNHLPYALSNARMARLRELFLDSDWGEGAITVPGYAASDSANPFVTFARIPPRARYQFLLDDVDYSLKSFVHGPVCWGQSALNVIRDHFHVFFLSPDSDLSVTDPRYLAEAAPLLTLPTAGGSNVLQSFYLYYKLKQQNYLELRERYYSQRYPDGPALDDVWDGDGDKLAALTLFRHFDNGSVLRGAVGGLPKTAMVLDYPILERIYYNLVAGYDVFSNIWHGVFVRQYMDSLRVEGEDLFLSFLAPDARQTLRDSWHQGVLSSWKTELENPLYGAERGTRVVFGEGTAPMQDLLTQILDARLPAPARGPRDAINGLHPAASGTPAVADPRTEAELDAAFALLAQRVGDFVPVLPEVVLVRVVRPGASDLIYSIVRNRDRLNTDFIGMEDLFLDPTNDTLTVVKGFLGSYPSFFFVVPFAKTGAFVRELLALRPESSRLEELVTRYGIRRGDPAFWTTLDTLNARLLADEPIDGGLLDLNRYENY